MSKFDLVKMLNDLTNSGWCPALVFDDNGHWALVTSGFQSCPVGDDAQDIQTVFWIEAHEWKDTIEEAVRYAIEQAPAGERPPTVEDAP